jgi:hypothetical protein
MMAGKHFLLLKHKHFFTEEYVNDVTYFKSYVTFKGIKRTTFVL